MTVREKLESFKSIDELLDYLENLGIDTSVLRASHKDLGVLIGNILEDKRYTVRIQKDIDRDNWFDNLGI